MKRWHVIAAPLAAFALLLSIIAGIIGVGKEGLENFCTQQSTYVMPVNAQVGIPKSHSSAEQVANAKIVIGVGFGRGFSYRDVKIALRTATGESELRNLDYGHLDSLGIYQIRPSQGHGSVEQVMDPVWSANNFYDRMSKVKNRDSLSEMEVAIRTQNPSREAYERNFPRTESVALAFLAELKLDATPDGSVVAPAAMMPQDVCVQLASFGVGGVNPSIEAVIQAALSQQGKPYTWNDGTSFSGSGFAKWAYEKAGVTLPQSASGQYLHGAPLTKPDPKNIDQWIKTLQRGDLIYWSDKSAPSALSIKHVAIYIGGSTVIDAKAQGAAVSMKPLIAQTTDLTILGATRPPMTSGTISGGWAWPVKNVVVTSPFGDRFHPTQRVWMLHDGVDLQAKLNTPIYAAHDGTVAAVVPDGQVIQPYGRGFGNQVMIGHGSGIESGYAHLNKFAPGITKGTVVRKGQVIGYAGTTGWSTGVHLHFRILHNGKAIDPIAYFRSQGLTLPSSRPSWQ